MFCIQKVRIYIYIGQFRKTHPQLCFFHKTFSSSQTIYLISMVLGEIMTYSGQSCTFTVENHVSFIVYLNVSL